MPHVLVVDDDADALPIRRLILERAGYSVSTATTPAQARALFSSAPPDAVLLDLRLPHLEDGLTLIREWRQAAPALHLVVLAGRTADLEETSERALVDRVLGKPVRSELLLEALRRPA